MAKRSTRNKMRFQAKKAIEDIDRAMEHLAKLDILQADRSPHVNNTLPSIVAGAETLKVLITRFRDTL